MRNPSIGVAAVHAGVYRSGFSTSQAAYDAAQAALWAAMDDCEARLSRSRFLLGDRCAPGRSAPLRGAAQRRCRGLWHGRHPWARCPCDIPVQDMRGMQEAVQGMREGTPHALLHRVRACVHAWTCGLALRVCPMCWLVQLHVFFWCGVAHILLVCLRACAGSQWLTCGCCQRCRAWTRATRGCSSAASAACAATTPPCTHGCATACRFSCRRAACRWVCNDPWVGQGGPQYRTPWRHTGLCGAPFIAGGSKRFFFCCFHQQGRSHTAIASVAPCAHAPPRITINHFFVHAGSPCWRCAKLYSMARSE